MINDALQKLTEGNQRFADGKSTHPNLDDNRRVITFENGQEPFAAILSCADSRAPIEMVFDQGIGDIFSVRTAGNVIDDVTLGSIELGVHKFNIPVLLIVGHTDCGAIKLAVENSELEGKMPQVIEKILPAVESVQQQFHKLSNDMLIYEVTKENAKNVAQELIERSAVLKERVASGKLKILAGIHDLKTGAVEYFE